MCKGVFSIPTILRSTDATTRVSPMHAEEHAQFAAVGGSTESDGILVDIRQATREPGTQAAALHKNRVVVLVTED